MEVIRLRDGNWLGVYNDLERGRYSLVAALSDDEGATWKWKRHLDGEPGAGDQQPVSLSFGDPGKGRRDPRDLQLLRAGREIDQACAAERGLDQGRRRREVKWEDL